MQRPDWAPESTDLERPSIAGMYDFFLGGSHNFAVDREAARRLAPAVPGVRQFLDIGSGTDGGRRSVLCGVGRLRA